MNKLTIGCKSHQSRCYCLAKNSKFSSLYSLKLRVSPQELKKSIGNTEFPFLRQFTIRINLTWRHFLISFENPGSWVYRVKNPHFWLKIRAIWAVYLPWVAWKTHALLVQIWCQTKTFWVGLSCLWKCRMIYVTREVSFARQKPGSFSPPGVGNDWLNWGKDASMLLEMSQNCQWGDKMGVLKVERCKAILPSLSSSHPKAHTPHISGQLLPAVAASVSACWWSPVYEL